MKKFSEVSSRDSDSLGNLCKRKLRDLGKDFVSLCLPESIACIGFKYLDSA